MWVCDRAVVRAIHRRWAACALALLLVTPLLTGALPGLPARPAQAAAAIALVQKGAVSVQSASGTNTPTLPAASTAGTLLVATVATSAGPIAAPSGWVQATTVGATGIRLDVWFYPGNPGGITSATFSSGGTASAGQLSEWSGVAPTAPLDLATPTVGSAGGSTITISSPSSPSQPGELGIAVAAQAPSNKNGVTTLSPSTGSSFTSLGTGTVAGGVAVGGAYAYDLPTTSAPSTSVTSNKAGNLVGILVTFRPPSTCSGGGLAFASPPGDVVLPAVTLNGTDRTTAGSLLFDVTDDTSTGAGWNVTGTSTAFRSGSRSLPATATTVTGATATAQTGNCTLPSNSVTYPRTLPAGATAPTATKLYNNAVGTSGAGRTRIALDVSLAVPANAYAGTYTSTWTISLASGP